MVYSSSPCVSVIIPTYNRAHLLIHSLESVLQQTFKDYEIIVVDDASTDNTRELLGGRYGKKIIYIGKEKNEGLSAARNTGIKASRGKYLAFLDDDDEWLAAKLELQIDLLQKKPLLGLVYCGYYEVNKDGGVIRKIKPTKRGNIYDELLCGNCVGPPSGDIVKKEVFDKAGYFDENLSSCEDWDMWIRISRFYEMDFVDQPLVKYKIHGGNMHRNLQNMEKTTFSVLNKCFAESFEDGGFKERKNKAFSSNCINLAWNYYQAGDTHTFKRILYQALEYYPLSEISIYGDDLPGKENVLFEVFHEFWNKPESQEYVDSRRNVFTKQYVQLAWEYYRNGDMRSFRRCVRKIFQYSLPIIPIRFAILYLKSFYK